MATPNPTPNGNRKPTLETLARSASKLDNKGKKSKPTRKKQTAPTKHLSLEMNTLTEEVVDLDPHELARNGHLGMLSALLEAGSASIKATDADGSTLLHAAASTNQVETMRYLVKNHAANLNATDNDGNTPLHIATISLAFDAIHLLLDESVDDTILNKEQDAPLHIATRKANIDLLNVFLQHPKINLVIPGYRNRTPLHIAAEFDLLDVVKAFNNAIIVVKEWKENTSFRLCAADSDNITPIHFAARNGSANVLRFMISRCTDHGYPIEDILKFIDEENSTPMHVAIDAGHTCVVKVLLEYGASPVVTNGDQIPPLHLACYQGRMEMVEMIVEHCGPEVIHAVTKSGQTPLHWGARSIQGGKILRYLISKGANLSVVDTQGQTALHYATIFGSLEAVKELVKHDEESIKIVDNLGRNVFHHAILHNRMAIADVLMKLPDSYNLIIQQDKSGHCSLHFALENNNEALLLYVVSSIEHRLCNVKNESGMNYLHSSAKSGSWKALGTLLKVQSSTIMINEVDSCGSTPLHHAAMQGHIKCTELLLSHGAMIHKCYSGYTPFLSAVRHGNSSCAEVLFNAHPFQREWTDDAGNTALHHAVQSGSKPTLSLCLDLGIPVTRNEDGVTFFDMLVSKSNIEMLQLVVEHDRWQECLDFPVLEENEHSFLRLIEYCPIVAKIVLDRCHEACSLPYAHPDYYENFDFKYLRLSKEDIEEQESEKEDIGKEDEAAVKERDMTLDMMSEVSVHVRSNRAADIGNVVIGRLGKTEKPLQALKTMLLHNRVNLLTHPVVVQYLKAKWRGYGRMIYGTSLLLFFIQTILLSVFVAITTPARLNIDEFTLDNIGGDNITLSKTSVASNTVRFVALFFWLCNTGILLANLMAIRLRVLNITKYDLAWMTTLSQCTSLAFLIPWEYSTYGFRYIYWEAGAISILSCWFTLLLYLKPFDLVGIYVTMFVEVLHTLMKVVFICILFLIAFTLPFYILAGDARPFTTIGDSMFITFSYILGEIDYEYYVTRFDRDSLQHPHLTYVFVILSASLLAVAVANFLIGLAVGDIDKIRNNAVIRQRSGEIRIFGVIDMYLPKYVTQKHNKRFHTVHLNCEVTIVRKIWRYVWRSLKETEEDPKDLYCILMNQQREINELKQLFTKQSEMHLQRYEELIHEMRKLSQPSGTIE